MIRSSKKKNKNWYILPSLSPRNSIEQPVSVPLPPLIRSRRMVAVAPSPPALRGWWRVRGGRQWRHRSPYDDVKAGQRYVTQAWREVDRSPTALLFHPLLLAPLSPFLSLAEYFFPEDYVASIRRLGRIEPLLPCFSSFFSFLRRIFSKSLPRLGKFDFEIKGMKSLGESFGRWVEWLSWMFRDLKFLESIGWGERGWFAKLSKLLWCVYCRIIITKCPGYLEVVYQGLSSVKYSDITVYIFISIRMLRLVPSILLFQAQKFIIQWISSNSQHARLSESQ